MYPDPTALTQMHLDDLRREAAEARRAARLVREGTEPEASRVRSAKPRLSLVTQLRRIHLLPQAGLPQV
jgi:hypothetical protein